MEVTLRYPESLHLSHNSFPLAPEHMTITDQDLSPYASGCLRVLKQNNNPKTKSEDKLPKHRSKKLGSSFNDRVKYLVHGLNLKFYLENGLELVEIHRGITFTQSRFLEGYIGMCMNKRQNASTKNEGDMYKLLSNALFGKMIEGVMNRMDCEFITNKVKATKSFTSPLFKGFMICDESLTVSFCHKKQLRMTQNWAVGFSILELSKLWMQRLFYETIKPRFERGVSVLMSDTDSWLMAVGEGDENKVMEKLKDVMDFSNFSRDHPLFDAKRKNVVGFLKNEVPCDVIEEFVGLRAKTYTFKTLGKSVESRAKGVKKCYKDRIPFERYLDCIRDIQEVKVRQVTIASKNHQNMLLQSNKIAFSSFDDKRYLLCAIHSVPYGSSLIEKFLLNGNRCFFCQNPRMLV